MMNNITFDFNTVIETITKYEIKISEIEDENEKLKDKLEKTERKAKVLERAIKIYKEKYGDIRFFNFDIAIKQAEKELSEEKK